MKTTINGINIAYDDHGIGIPVIFLHAFPLNRSMWEGELKTLLLEERYRLVALDWPGFGESDIVSDISTMELFADCVIGLMDTLGMPSAILCGLSMGGYAAFAFLRKYPRRLAGLILSDTRPEADTPEAQANRENVARIAETQGTEAIADMQVPRVLSEYTRLHHPQIELRVRQMINAAGHCSRLARYGAKGRCNRSPVHYLLPNAGNSGRAGCSDTARWSTELRGKNSWGTVYHHSIRWPSFEPGAARGISASYRRIFAGSNLKFQYTQVRNLLGQSE